MENNLNTANHVTNQKVETIAKTNKIINKIRCWYYEMIIRKYVDHCNTFLDVGCGNGLFVDKLRYIGKSCKGIEINPKYKKENIDIMNYLDETEKYDCVFNSQFIEHINQFEFMDKMLEICEDTLITIAPRPNKKFWDDPTHIRPYTKKAIERLYKLYGFNVVYSRNLFPTNSFIVIGRKPIEQIKDETPL